MVRVRHLVAVHTRSALTSSRFAAALKARNVVLLTYRDLIAKEGLKSMRRPVD
jgi:hypothetical protein